MREPPRTKREHLTLLWTMGESLSTLGSAMKRAKQRALPLGVDEVTGRDASPHDEVGRFAISDFPSSIFDTGHRELNIENLLLVIRGGG